MLSSEQAVLYNDAQVNQGRKTQVFEESLKVFLRF